MNFDISENFLKKKTAKNILSIALVSPPFG